MMRVGGYCNGEDDDDEREDVGKELNRWLVLVVSENGQPVRWISDNRSAMEHLQYWRLLGEIIKCDQGGEV